MGKRNKDTNVGRRRPMIQLGSSQKQGFSAVSRKTRDESPAAVKENHEETISEAANNEMDYQLADFLAEINSLEAPNTKAENDVTQTLTTAVPITQSDTSNMLYNPDTFDPSTQGHLLPENWQACYDDNYMCYYYWNTVTNEVQWYPPVATIPPPPPPPPPVETEETKNVIEMNDSSSDSKAQLNGFESSDDIKGCEVKSTNNEENLKDVESSEISTDDDIVSSKTKDKELMSQIKERIRKKKEDKQRQEEEDLSKKQKEKEESLRERLIRKKLERDKSVENTKDEKLSEQTLNPTLEEPFVVDMFAEGEGRIQRNKKHEKVLSPKIEKTFDISTDENVKSDETENEIETNEGKVKNDVTKENKGGWRIIDAVYDDDDEDHADEENDTGSAKKEESPMEESDTEAEGVVKKGEEMDDYAEMLLEDAIGKDEATAVDSTKSDDSTATPILPPVPPPSAPPPPEHDERPPLPPEDEPLPSMEITSTQEDENNRKLVGLMSTELFEKLDFLGINKKELRNLQIYYIELETRMRDWQAGALNTKYFLENVNNLNVEIQKYEETAAPHGWLCHWNSEYKMYYYHNSTTGNSQWEYPQQQQQQQPTLVPTATPVVASHPTNTFQPSQVVVMPPHIMPIMSMPAANYMHAGGMMMATPVVSEQTTTTLSAAAAALVSPAHGFSREPIPLESKKRSATDSDMSSSDPYRDPYRVIKKKKEIMGFPDQIAEDNQVTSEAESGTSSPIPKSVIAAAPVIRNVSREASPSLNALPDEYLSPFSPTTYSPKTDNAILTSKGKLKKKKKLDASGLPSKKMKHVSSLVQKWQTVKQKVVEEENVDDEYEEEIDYHLQSEKRIEEWKKEMEVSGKKDYNPNFQEIKGDWKERLKRKSTT